MPEYSSELEKAARDRGFKSASEMLLFVRRRSESLRDSHTVSGKGTAADKAPKKKSESGGGGMAGFFEGLSRGLDKANKK